MGISDDREFQFVFIGIIYKTELAKLDGKQLEQWLDEKYPGRTVERDGSSSIVTTPVNFHRRNGRQTIKVKKPKTEQADSIQTDDSLIMALAKAYAWQEELESGGHGSIAELAKAKKVDRSYVGRVLQLTSLAPSLVEQVLKGRDLNLSFRKLRRGIQAFWSDQIQRWR